jgi:hypothetical protein
MSQINIEVKLEMFTCLIEDDILRSTIYIKEYIANEKDQPV